MDVKALDGRSHRSFLKHLESAENRLSSVYEEAEATWTPGQVLGELIFYLDRVDNFTASDISASWAQKRVQWFTRILSTSVRRSLTSGLDPDSLNAVFDALKKHDTLLSSERTLKAKSVQDARNLIRLEISFIDNT